MMKQAVFILTMVLLQKILFSQNLNFQSYSSVQGLSQNSIYSIAQTKDGFMWFGTQDGLNRFDGRNFTSIIPTLSDSNSKRIVGNKISKMITALCADKDDWLWVGTTYEILVYNRYSNTFLLPQNVFKGFRLPIGTWIAKIAEGSDNNLWILTQKEGLFCYNKSSKNILR